MITKCRVCKGKVGYALKVKGMTFVFCKECTLLQRQDDILFNIQFDFTGGQLEVDYYPYFLQKKEYDCVDENSCIFFSLMSLEKLLSTQGYKVINAEVVGNKLCVAFEKYSRLEQIQRFEKKKKINNQFTFFLWSLK